MSGLYTKVKLYLEANGKSYDSERLVNFNLRDDGSGAFIEDWSVDGVTKPTDAELDALESQADAVENLNEILSSRGRSYPKLAAQFDLLYHAIDDDALNKTSDFYTKLKKVKDDNPKPTE